MSVPAVDPSVTGSPTATKVAWWQLSRAPLALATLLATATALSPGCTYGPDEEATGMQAQALNANTRTAFDYFVGRGLTAIQAAGIVGNLIQESSVDPRAVQPGGPGRGIAQWSVGGRWDHDAGDNVAAYASSHGGASVWSLSLQLDFIWFELTSFSGYGLAQLRASSSVSAATIAFENRFEGCGSCLESQRIAYAQQVLAAYGSAAVWGGQFVSQTFPSASAGSVSIHAGSAATISITMRNIGTHAWDAHTCIATTVARDRRSVFAGSEWPAANRPACVPSGTSVAPNTNHTFTWAMHAPAMPGRYDEHWGMVEEGVTWFSAAGEGGPVDTDLEGIFTVTTPPPPPPPPDAGFRDAGVVDAGHDGGLMGDAVSESDGAPDNDAVSEDVVAVDAGDSGHADAARDQTDGGHADVARDHTGDGGTDEMPPGCACRAAGTHGSAGSGVGTLIAAALALASIRRRRRSSGT